MDKSVNEQTTGTAEDEPAMPSHGSMGEVAHRGLTAREHAAIALRLPESGTEWLDAMIHRARLLDTATALMPECEANHDGVLTEPTLEEAGYVHHVGNVVTRAGEEAMRSALAESDAAGGNVTASGQREPKVGDIVVITEACGEYYEAGTRAKLTERNALGWLGCFQNLGNSPGSYKEGTTDGTWFVGDSFGLEPTHA